MSRRAGGRVGQTAVEFALIGTILLALFFGVFEVGRFAFGASAVSNGAREGARWSVASGNVPAAGTACDATLTGLKAAVYAQIQGITPVPTITAAEDAGQTWCAVTVTWSYRPWVGGLSFFKPFSLSSTSREYYN
ncbi:MAG: TadE-like protein [Chloroflexota bacterium]|nr:TadE-like protein [Chloroflexota bacterium]